MVERFDGNWSHIHPAYMLSNYPLIATHGPNLLPPSRDYSIPITAHTSQHRSPESITAHVLSHRPPWFSCLDHLATSMTSLCSIIVTNDFILSSSLHHYDTSMTSQPGLWFRTLLDSFHSHPWCIIPLIHPTRFTFISIIDHYPLFHTDHSFISPNSYLSVFGTCYPFGFW